MGIWLAVGKTGNEYLYDGDEAPIRSENGAITFDGMIIKLPKGAIRHLTQKILTPEDEPVSLTVKKLARVTYHRNTKNIVLHRLVEEKYGKENYLAGFLKELEDAKKGKGKQ